MTGLLTILTVIALGAVTSPLPQEAPDGPDYRRVVEERHAVGPGAELRVHHSLGALQIEASDQDSVELRAVIEVRGPGARELGEQIRIEVSGAAPLGVKTVYPEVEKGGVSFGASLHLRLPRGHRVLIAQDFGDASVRGIQDGLVAEVTSGRLRVEESRGATDLRTSFGSIDLIACEGDVRIQSSSSPVSATRLRCDRLRISSSFGNVELKSVHGDVEIESKSGSVDVRDVEGSVKARGSFGKQVYEDISGTLDFSGRSAPVSARAVGGPTTIESGFGNVALEDCRGAVTITAESAQVVASTLSGPVTVKCRFGNARLQGVAGDCRVDAQSGTIEIRGVDGGLSARTSFGGVRASDIAGDVEVAAESGNVHLGGLRYRHPREDRGVRIHCRATYGSIELTLPAPPSFRLDAATTFGTIRSDFPLEGHESELSNESCRCTLGQGLAEVTLQSQSGGIRIKAAKGP